jgi:hypothetical protein
MSRKKIIVIVLLAVVVVGGVGAASKGIAETSWLQSAPVVSQYVTY